MTRNMQYVVVVKDKKKGNSLSPQRMIVEAALPL